VVDGGPGTHGARFHVRFDFHTCPSPIGC
jgi:hypothetical protein